MGKDCAEMKCFMCPRECGADRDKRRGFCKAGGNIEVARASLHFWEEPCISGSRGSGTVFFSGCPLHCVYCQNQKISCGGAGRPVSANELCDIFLSLESRGANNINLVTPTQYSDMIIPSIERAKARGIKIPFIYNCGGYEKVETLRRLEGLIDIYMPDFKYLSRECAARYSAAPDYPETAQKAIDEMVRQIRACEFDENGIMRRGVIVRHLLLPGKLAESKDVMEHIFVRYGKNVYFSVMSQFTPMSGLEAYPEINRKVSAEEYEELVGFCLMLGMKNVYIQDGESASESFIPDFGGEL